MRLYQKRDSLLVALMAGMESSCGEAVSDEHEVMLFCCMAWFVTKPERRYHSADSPGSLSKSTMYKSCCRRRLDGRTSTPSPQEHGACREYGEAEPSWYLTRHLQLQARFVVQAMIRAFSSRASLSLPRYDSITARLPRCDGARATLKDFELRCEPTLTADHR